MFMLNLCLQMSEKAGERLNTEHQPNIDRLTG